jgi:hypothetical protein
MSTAQPIWRNYVSARIRHALISDAVRKMLYAGTVPNWTLAPLEPNARTPLRETGHWRFA